LKEVLSKLNNTRISHRLSLLIIVFLTSMAGMSGLGIYELLKVERNYEVVSENIYPNSLVIAQARDALYRLAVLQRNHLLYNEATMRISQED
jgi:CHASE3 domain sensor protein